MLCPRCQENVRTIISWRNLLVCLTCRDELTLEKPVQLRLHLKDRKAKELTLRGR